MERQLIECFQQLLLAQSSLILFRNNLLHIISHLVVLRRRGGFQFSIRQQIISYSCNYFAGTRVKCTRLKKSDLFSIFWPKPLEAPFPSDLLHFFQFGTGSPPGKNVTLFPFNKILSYLYLAKHLARITLFIYQKYTQLWNSCN